MEKDAHISLASVAPWMAEKMVANEAADMQFSGGHPESRGGQARNSGDKRRSGAAYAAGLAVEFFSGLDEIVRQLGHGSKPGNRTWMRRGRERPVSAMEKKKAGGTFPLTGFRKKGNN